ncbi:MAG: tetraacyldisaccharide 4'-kinase [Alphaproteobacteria bacterium]|nr:tetraacyldisaccharide 4'-kinase [Alphaproteobacteria bacterium]
MKAPAFWYDEKSVVASLLSPLERVYSSITSWRRRFTSPYRAMVPVICIGNIVAGGAGKTPTTLALANMLKQQGAKPVIVSRGYGGSEAGPLRVDPALHTANMVGDEALLLAQTAPCWIGRNKVATIKAAEAGATHILMDDGFQNPTVAHDLSLLVIDGHTGLGNGHLIPAGPLRETLADALERATAVIMIGNDRYNISGRINKPIFNADVYPRLPEDFPRSARFFAFAGIARPQKFYTSCEKSKLKVVGTHDFDDHHFFSLSELKELERKASENDSILLTTNKDWVRLPEDFRAKTLTLPVELVFKDKNRVLEFFQSDITATRDPS